MTTFADLGLSPSTVDAVTATGYTVPTPIQEQAIPVALAGRDVLGIAQTGTGKTAAFTLPMIDRLKAGRAKALMPRSLVIAPTRELADQVAASFEKYAKGTKLSWALLIGGVSFKDQEMKISRGVDVLIATPGRLLDFYERRKIMLLDVKTLVVDEADRMLDMGFIPDLEKIFEITPKVKQTLFFSATMPPEITRLTTQFLKDPTRIEVSRPASTGENIKQYVVNTPLGDPKSKRTVLRVLMERSNPDSAIIFCNRKTEVDVVAKSLKTHGFDAAPIHGDLDQSTRMKTLESFRKGELKLLVASDVAARGLDIPAVSHVFNYDVPHHAEDYVHRIGRTGRAGRSGEAFVIVGPNDGRSWEKVTKLTKLEPEELVLDIDWEEAAKAAETDKARFGASRDRAKRETRSDRFRPVKDHGERAATTPAIADPDARPAEPLASETAERRPRRERAPRRERSEPEAAAVGETAAPEAVTTEPQEDRPRRRRSRGGDRTREDRAPREDATPVEANPATDDQPIAEAPVRQQPVREAADREFRSPRNDRSRDERPREPRRAEEPRRDRGRGSSREEREESGVVGFGSDTPAFLMAAPRLAPITDEANDGDDA